MHRWEHIQLYHNYKQTTCDTQNKTRMNHVEYRIAILQRKLAVGNFNRVGF